ncbi:MAG: hypothetical protein NC344_10105 [Bacteroidales bacterium]|nr:hypothetical protein [Bacteroidales bacterium]MCM1148156.1 hypothetical protein [Bacteroidales bacterium]MCM1207117.1 hypothetical protein [Bacillota bacterium]MCM1510869.1 hypothetical protein [Clostridium sp.]
MCIINEIKSFVTHGAETLRKSSKGHYDCQTDEVKKIRHELLETQTGRADDAANLRKDREKVGHDVRVSWDKLILENG